MPLAAGLRVNMVHPHASSDRAAVNLVHPRVSILTVWLAIFSRPSG
jgi:hypothetical protein